MTDLRMLPHDTEAEQCVLGAAMLSPKAAALAVGVLGGDDFYRLDHQEIFKAIAGLARESQPVDVMSVRAELERVGKPGAGLYLVELAGVVPSAGNASYYVNRVRELGSKRFIITELVDLESRAYDADVTADNLVAEAEDIITRLRRLSDEDTSGEFSTMGAFVDETDAEYDWLLPGVLERMDRVIVVASEGAGKTTLARQMAVMMAAGVHPFRWQIRIPPVRTLYVDLENPPALIRRKARHLANQGRMIDGWEESRCWRWTRPGGIDIRKPHDQHLLDQKIRESRAEIIFLGPLYKTFADGGERSEQLNTQVAQALDRMRERHKVALWLETHAPMEQQGQRSLRPLGSGVWTRWPEFGLALRKDTANPNQVFVERFRGDRDERSWPHRLMRSSPWPWAALYDGGFPVSEATGT